MTLFLQKRIKHLWIWYPRCSKKTRRHWAQTLSRSKSFALIFEWFYIDFEMILKWVCPDLELNWEWFWNEFWMILEWFGDDLEMILISFIFKYVCQNSLKIIEFYIPDVLKRRALKFHTNSSKKHIFWPPGCRDWAQTPRHTFRYHFIPIQVQIQEQL